MNPVPFSQLTPHGQNQHMVAQLEALKQIRTPDCSVTLVINLHTDATLHMASTTTDHVTITNILASILAQQATTPQHVVRPNEQN